MALELLLFFTLFFAAAFFWPTWRLWRRDRINALVLPYDDSVHGTVGRWFRGTLAAIFVILALMSFGAPETAFGSLSWLTNTWIGIAGWALLAFALGWVVLAQAQMGASWRIGIDPGAPQPLVGNGLFGLSRNPIFMGMRIALLGLFMVLPNAFTLAVLGMAEVLMQIQVRLEETHLERVHGRDYQNYRNAVRRWI
jgi:protein-S-isoprenylcysteine O-methyltransferase Ste14